MEEKSAGFVEFIYVGEGGRPTPIGWHSRPWTFDLKRTDTTMPLGCGAGHSSYNLLRVFD
jgi:hypothetical protein